MTETLPAMLLAAAFAVGQGFRSKSFGHPGFLPAIACYAFVAAAIILFWPGGSTPRYFFPMVLPLCVLGALGYDSLGKQRPEIVAPLLLLTAGLLAYALAYSVASPFFPTRFRHTQVEAARLSELVEAQPAPIYTIGATALNVLPYFPGRILFVSPGELMSVSAPAWMVLPVADADVLLSQRRGGLREMTPSGVNEWRLLRLDK